jgi:hypothetical protein
LQALPQNPQLFGSVDGSAHAFGQVTVPAGQLHVPLMQFAPVLQAMPQAPQFAVSLATFTQALLQMVSPF